jgi:uncharacterized protein YecT (DUF1311 family)
MSACFAAEAEAWEAVMAGVYGDLAGLMRATSEDPDTADPGAQERLLAAAQDAWAAFRDADCAQAAAAWGDGSLRSVAAAQCVLDRTGERALELTGRRRAFENP